MKKLFIFAIAIVMVMVSTMSAFAAEANYAYEETSVTATSIGAATREFVAPVSPSEGNRFPYTNITSGLVCSTTWKTIATSTKGFNCNVYIQCSNNGFIGLGVSPSDIRMLGKNGNVLWSESGAVRGQGWRVFGCGSDVYTIQIRTQSGNGSACAYQTNHAPTDK